MKKRHEFKLLSKTTFIYLIFTLVAFLGSGLFLTHEANEFINWELEHKYRRIEYKTRSVIDREGRRTADLEKLPRNIQIMPISQAPPEDAYPTYSDTTIYISRLEETWRARNKTVAIEAGGQFYRLTMTELVEDYLSLRDDIFRTMLPAFILLVVGIVAFNFLMSGYFFRPFNKILDIMRSYKVGQRTNLEKVKTNTLEFNKMQDLFHSMINRIEQDYRHLREYTENMAHEMQTPLAVIRNKTDNLIADESMMKEHGKTVKTIYEETNHLSRLGNTLNLITKIENGEFDNITQIETRPIIEQHVDAIRELAGLKSLTIDTDLTEEHRLEIDPYLLDIVLKNLLRNSVMYGTDNGPIRVTTSEKTLEVSNYGPPMEDRPDKLFQRFYRNNNHQGSLGLGLSLVKKICEVSKLQITYQYEEGQHIFRILRNGEMPA
ncbi:MAG TPA: HAMP domain-containing sensor histidine kinase [bacterium]|nr:HAMP domain-containing sensor histidine kinase [bacterium]